MKNIASSGIQLNLFSESDLERKDDMNQTKSENYQTQDKIFDHTKLFERLSHSSFRSSFHLKQKDIEYIRQKGWDTIRKHATDFVAQRLAPAFPKNDGKQTPMHGHPVFIAQHATGCCCRGCFYKWHHIDPGKPLSTMEQQYAVSVLMEWIKKEYLKYI